MQIRTQTGGLTAKGRGGWLGCVVGTDHWQLTTDYLKEQL